MAKATAGEMTVPETLLPDGEQELRPVVILPRQGLPGLAIAGVAVVAAIILFLTLDARRRTLIKGEVVPAPASAFASPPPLFIPPERSFNPVADYPPPSTIELLPPPSAPTARAMLPQPTISQIEILPVAPRPSAASLPSTAPAARQSDSRVEETERQSALVFDGGRGAVGNPPLAVTAPPAIAGGTAARSGAGLGGDDVPARAGSIGDQTMIMPTGTIIPAVLETPIDTARPGLVRALVSRDTRGFNGRRVLVPRGSRLIGEYQADVRLGQNRVLVTWNRLIRPDGVSIRLVSPTSDSLGGAGVQGRVETFFWQRFASALLQSAMTVGVNLASRPGNGSVIIGLPSSSVGNVVGQALVPTEDLKSKISVKQGAALSVFVARDLDFSSVSVGG